MEGLEGPLITILTASTPLPIVPGQNRVADWNFTFRCRDLIDLSQAWTPDQRGLWRNRHGRHGCDAGANSLGQVEAPSIGDRKRNRQQRECLVRILTAAGLARVWPLKGRA